MNLHYSCVQTRASMQCETLLTLNEDLIFVGGLVFTVLAILWIFLWRPRG